MCTAKKHPQKQVAVRPQHLSARYRFSVARHDGCVFQQSVCKHPSAQTAFYSLQMSQTVGSTQSLYSNKISPSSSTSTVASTLDLFESLREPRDDAKLRPSVFQVLCGDEGAHAAIRL